MRSLSKLQKALWKRHKEFYELGFEDLGEPGSVEDIRFLALALGGETGELQNLVKKQWRDGGYLKGNREIGMEIADVISYALILGKSLGRNVVSDMNVKFNEVDQRIAERKKNERKSKARI